MLQEKWTEKAYRINARQSISQQIYENICKVMQTLAIMLRYGNNTVYL